MGGRTISPISARQGVAELFVSYWQVVRAVTERWKRTERDRRMPKKAQKCARCKWDRAWACGECAPRYVAGQDTRALSDIDRVPQHGNVLGHYRLCDPYAHTIVMFAANLRPS